MNKETIFLSVLLSFIASFLFYFMFGAGNITDYVVVKSIPVYPNSNDVRVYASSGFPDGSPSGDITFDTNDSTEAVLNFYKQELSKRGWQLEQESESPVYSYRTFTKTVAGKKFKAYVDKYSSINETSTRGWVSITHGK